MVNVVPFMIFVVFRNQLARNGWVTIASIAHHSLFLGGLQVLRCEE